MIRSGHFTLTNQQWQGKAFPRLSCVCGMWTPAEDADVVAVWRTEHAECIDVFGPANQCFTDAGHPPPMWAMLTPMHGSDERGWRCSVGIPAAGWYYAHGEGDTREAARDAMLEQLRADLENQAQTTS